MSSVVTHRPTALIPLGLLAVSMVLFAGCSGRAPLYRTTTKKSKITTPTKAAPSPIKPRRFRPGEMVHYRTIAKLWNAIDRHHDALGYALHPRYPSTTVARPRTRPRPRYRHGPSQRVTPRPGAGRPPTLRPPPPRINRPPVGVRAGSPLCRRACNHVRAICYAARRICQIARRLRDYRSQLTCKRATARCADARRATRRRCRSCS